MTLEDLIRLIAVETGAGSALTTEVKVWLPGSTISLPKQLFGEADERRRRK